MFLLASPTADIYTDRNAIPIFFQTRRQAETVLRLLKANKYMASDYEVVNCDAEEGLVTIAVEITAAQRQYLNEAYPGWLLAGYSGSVMFECQGELYRLRPDGQVEIMRAQ